jgi:hypothetical protein
MERSNHMNRIKVLVSAGAMVAAGLAVTPVLTSQAAYSDCPTNKVCAWQNNNFSGDFLGYRAPGGGLVNISSGNNNRMSSWANRTLTNARWYQLANASPEGFCANMINTSSNPDLPDSQNDKMSSWATNGSC